MLDSTVFQVLDFVDADDPVLCGVGFFQDI